MSAKLTNIDERLAQLSPEERRRVIARIQRKLRPPVQTNTGLPKAGPEIPRARRDKPLALSFAQQRLWFLEQLQGPDEGSPYNEFGGVEIHGQLDLDVLQRSLTEVVRRHEVLRTTFLVNEGLPYLQINESQPVELPLIDLRGTASDKQARRLQQLIQQQAWQHLDLKRGPLLSCLVVRLSDDRYVLMVTVHHIVCDHPSAHIFTRELVACYEAFRADRSPCLPELQLQYADFAAWERTRLEGDLIDRQISYWKKQLAGAPPLIQLYTDGPRPTVPSVRGAMTHFQLASETGKAIGTLNEAVSTTEFMTLLSVFLALLQRYTDQQDIVVGTTLANRTRQELEDLIGLFINVLPMRVEMSGNPTFRELLMRVRTTALEAFDHQDIPFDMLVESLKIERHRSYSPIFQVLFVFYNDPPTAHSLDGLRFSPLQVDPGTAKYDLTLTIARTDGGFAATFDYNTDLFRADSIERMAGHFKALLQGVLDDPDRELHRIPLLSSAERHQLLNQWNAHTSNDRPQKCIHHLFEDRVQRTPDSVAVVMDDQRMTYAELNARANQLAWRLRETGVGPEVLVGICVERCIEMVVGVLSILKAGGAYVPMDPNEPVQRLAFMLDDAAVRVLLIQRELIERLPKLKAHVISLHAGGPLSATDRSGDLPPQAAVDNLAYVIYTSGSTGRAKGVMITHGSLAAHCLEMSKFYALTAEDRCLQFASLSFDPSVEEVFTALTVGAQLVLRGPAVWSPLQFIQKTAAHKLTVCQLPAAYWQQLVEDSARHPIDDAVLASLRQVVVYGEAMPVDTVAQWSRSCFKGIELINSYGPTETTITSTSFKVPPADSARRRVPIGRANGNRVLYVLDRSGDPVPVGVAGELHIGGIHVARGYLNRPELTSEKFIPNPFGVEPNARLYKTGDLCRWLPDGNLEFLGRRDHQLKLRGFRIELGEIEAALATHQQVREAVVLTQEGAAGEQRLVAYVSLADIAAQRAPPSAYSLREHLKRSLPEYMVPTAYAIVESLPLTSSGKVDRMALRNIPTPLLSSPGFEPPADELESRLVEIWSDMLRVERVGRHDNFFELGGHSLMATQLLARVEDVFGVKLSLQVLFDDGSLAGMADELRRDVESEETVARLRARIDQMSAEQIRTLLEKKRREKTSTDPGTQA